MTKEQGGRSTRAGWCLIPTSGALKSGGRVGIALHRFLSWRTNRCPSDFGILPYLVIQLPTASERGCVNLQNFRAGVPMEASIGS